MNFGFFFNSKTPLKLIIRDIRNTRSWLVIYHLLNLGLPSEAQEKKTTNNFLSIRLMVTKRAHFLCFVCLFRFFVETFLLIRLLSVKILTHCRHLWTLSCEGYLACHTYCGMVICSQWQLPKTCDTHTCSRLSTFV